MLVKRKILKIWITLNDNICLKHTKHTFPVVNNLQVNNDAFNNDDNECNERMEE